ncbi:MAG: phosphoribosylamine--glycine ligase [Candidatus Aminicenantes bacterium]|nr:phosphoribosylamine--glycine ligase [Candidatus Aminicenantes bacterium]MDH5383136.1 phosphoribosylamine--glycine ligase [Candidatus Aminicenantes bacterium]MDH5742449.1 phosphoribosylamine--glycine ligase [Candidatus Aminicenantes bacterium]
MKILVVGSGGREHALAWKISQSPLLEKLYCAPGNAGTMSIAENVSLNAEDMQGLVDFAYREKIDLTVVGPEAPLTLGIVDVFEERGLKIFGPKKNAAELEGSKIFAKQFMERSRIPTAEFEIADSPEQAKSIVNSGRFSFPLVIKADGLAAGKGVIICRNAKRAEEAIHTVMVEKKFGEAGNSVIVEEFLVGKEASFIVISDGVKVLPLVTTMDHKPVFDGDKGPNTGGMGAISPSPYIDKQMFDLIMNTIVFTSITRMLEEERKFKGILYVGLMLTDEGPKVLEYNCRFGDPETQPQVLRMEGDLVEVLLAAVEENVLEKEIQWNSKTSGCVVVASGGYPIKYEKEKLIEGLDEAASLPGIVIFHAGTAFRDGKYYTSGGRVLNICASENTLEETMGKIYQTISKIFFEAMHWRRDIGAIREEE